MPAASSPRRPAAPYRTGQRVRGLHHHPQHGTVATTGTVTGCTARLGGWTLHVAHADEERTYLLSPAGHSDYVSAVAPGPRPAPAGRLHGFYPSPQALAAIPTLYGSEDVPLGEKVLHVHYFTGGATGGSPSTTPRQGAPSATPASAGPRTRSGATSTSTSSPPSGPAAAGGDSSNGTSTGPPARPPPPTSPAAAVRRDQAEPGRRTGEAPRRSTEGKGCDVMTYEATMRAGAEEYGDVVAHLTAQGLPTVFTQTGGMCAALQVQLDNGQTLLITDEDDSLSWNRQHQRGWAVGRYGRDEGQCEPPLAFGSSPDRSLAVLDGLVREVLRPVPRRGLSDSR